MLVTVELQHRYGSEGQCLELAEGRMLHTVGRVAWSRLGVFLGIRLAPGARPTVVTAGGRAVPAPIASVSLGSMLEPRKSPSRNWPVKEPASDGLPCGAAGPPQLLQTAPTGPLSAHPLPGAADSPDWPLYSSSSC